MKIAAIYAMQVLVGLAALAVGCATLAGASFLAAPLDMLGFGPGFRLMAGSTEIIAGFCLFAPRACVFGAMLLVCLMVGTVGATVGHVATLRSAALAQGVPQLTVYKTHDRSLWSSRHGATEQAVAVKRDWSI